MAKQVQYEDGEWSREIDMRPSQEMTTSDPIPGKVTMTITETKRIDVDAEDVKSFEAGGWHVVSDPTPGNHDELLAEAAEQFETGENHQSDIVGRKLIAALRTEQSARQAAEREMHSRELHHFEVEEENEALQQRIDAALALVEQIGNHVAAEYEEDRNLDQMILQLRSFTAPIESNEPDHG